MHHQLVWKWRSEKEEKWEGTCIAWMNGLERLSILYCSDAMNTVPDKKLSSSDELR